MNRRHWALGMAGAGWMMCALGAQAGFYLSPPQHYLPLEYTEVAAPDPVSANDGTFFFSLPLMDLGGPMGLGFTLHYHSYGAKANWDLNDLPNQGVWSWDPLAVLSTMQSSGTTHWQFQIERGQAAAFAEQPDGSLQLTDESVFGKPNSPLAFQAVKTGEWVYFLDPRNGRVKMFENFSNNFWRIAAQVDRQGNALAYTYRAEPGQEELFQPVRIEDGLGRWIELEYVVLDYNWENYISRVTDHAGREVRLEYEKGGDIVGGANALRNAVDVMGGTNRFAYAPFTNGFTIYRNGIGGHQLPEGNTPWTQEYGAFPLYAGDQGEPSAVIRQTDAYGNVLEFAYDTNAHRVAVAWPDGGTNRFAHDGRGQPPLEVVDATGGQTVFTQNANRQVESVTDRSGGVTALQFDPDTRQLLAVTNPLGNAMTFEYAATTQAVVNPVTLESVGFVFRDLAARHWPDGTSESFERDGRGNVTGRVDRAGGRWSFEYDAQGNLLRRTDPAGGEERFTYAADGLPESAIVPGGGTNVFTHDALGRLTTITFPDDTRLEYAYDLAGRLLSVSNEVGDEWTYEYDANGNLTRATGPTGAEKSYTYDLMDRIVTNAPSYGEAMSFEYDAMGRIARKSIGGFTNEIQRDALGNVTNARIGRVRRSAAYDASGRPIQVARDGFGHEEIQRDALGLVTGRVFSTGYGVQMARDANGVVTQIVDTVGRTSSWTHAGGRLVSVELPLAGADQRTYAAGRLSAYTGRDGGTWRYGYTPDGLLAAVTNPAGGVQQWEYDDMGQVVKAIREDGAAWEYAWDERGHLAAIQTPGTSVWAMIRDERGQPLMVMNPVGGVEFYAYTEDGLLAGVGDFDTAVMYEYDSLRRLVRTERADGEAWQMSYEPTNGWLEAVTAPGGGVYGRIYDEYGRLAGLTDPDGVASAVAYDEHGRVTGVVARAERPLAYEYDAAGRVIAITGPAGTGQQVEYDDLNRPVSIVTGGETTRYEYDALGRVAAISNSLTGEERVYRDVLGVVTSRVDALGRETRFESDAVGNVTGIVLSGGQALALAYDADGSLVRLELPGGIAQTYAVDELGALVEWTDANGQTWQVERSPMGRVEATGDPLGRTNRYEYNENGWLTAVEFPDGARRTYLYDLDGAVTGEVYAAAGGGVEDTLSYVYDVLGNLVAADGLELAYDNLGQVVATVCHGETNSAAYDAAGRLTEVGYGDAMTVTYQYDPATGRLTNQFDSLTGTQIGYDYDAQGRLAGMRRSNGQNAAYEYDAGGSVTRITDGDVLDLEYAYDANGRIGSVGGTWPLEAGSNLVAGVREWAYDAAGQITSAGHAYNDRGQPTNLPGRAIEWRDNQPAAIGGMTMSYSGLDHLLELHGSAVPTRLHYNLALGNKPVRENNRLYVWNPGGELLYMVNLADGNAVYHYHADATGSILALSDQAGTVGKAYAYDPFGQIVAETGSLRQPFTFGGVNGFLRLEAFAGQSPLGMRRNGDMDDIYINGKLPRAATTWQEYEEKSAEIERNIAVYEHLIAMAKEEASPWEKKMNEYEAFIRTTRMYGKNPFFWAAGALGAVFNENYLPGGGPAWRNYEQARRERGYVLNRIRGYEAEIRKWEARKEALRPKTPPPVVTAKTLEIDKKIGELQDLSGRARVELRALEREIEKREADLHKIQTLRKAVWLPRFIPGNYEKTVGGRIDQITTQQRTRNDYRRQLERLDAEIEKLEAEKQREIEVETALYETQRIQEMLEAATPEIYKRVMEEGGSYGRGWHKALRMRNELMALIPPEYRYIYEEMEELQYSLQKEAAEREAREIANMLQDPVAAPQPKTENSSAVVPTHWEVAVPAFAPANYDPKANDVLNQWMPDPKVMLEAAKNTPANAGELWMERQMRIAEFGFDPLGGMEERLKHSMEHTPPNAGELWQERLLNESK